MMQEYFENLEKGLKEAYELATAARKKCLDPEEYVDILLAKDMRQRAVALAATISKPIFEKKEEIVNRIIELEKEYGAQDWRVAMQISLEIAKETLCKFENQKEAMEIGLRIGLAYVTNGIVSSPLEGFTELNIGKRNDGKDYLSLSFAGPIRSAGTTAVCIFLMIADYVRKELGYHEYDPAEEEIKRTATEIYDYHEFVTNIQYLPSEEEIDFLIRNYPLQIDGPPTEEVEVSNYKDLPRIKSNNIRNGPCLVIGEGLAQKAAKFWSKFQKFYKEFDMHHWIFLEKFVKLQAKIRAKEKTEEGVKIKPNFTYIKDLVAGRPVLTHPLAKGGFRLRYGRCRNSGFSAQALHPATMSVLNNLIASGSQLKVERPGKAAVIAVCDTIEGPIVKLRSGEVLFWKQKLKQKK